MTRGQRRRHAWIWLVLGPVILAGLVAGLVSRRSAPVQASPDVEETAGAAGAAVLP